MTITTNNQLDGTQSQQPDRLIACRHSPITSWAATCRAHFAQGFLSGIGHPIIGVDHFLFIIGVGLLAGILGRKLLLPAAFILGTWGGAALHLFGLNIPFAEAAIVVSVLLMAVAVIGNWRGPVALTAGLVAAGRHLPRLCLCRKHLRRRADPALRLPRRLCPHPVRDRVRRGVGVRAAADARQTLANASTRVAGGAMVGVAHGRRQHHGVWPSEPLQTAAGATPPPAARSWTVATKRVRS